MAIDTTIHRDAEGRVALTPDQAEALARRDLLACGYPAPGDYDADHAAMAAIQRAGEYPAAALARWVLRWAPVVRAARPADNSVTVCFIPDPAGGWQVADLAGYTATDADALALVEAIRAAMGMTLERDQ